MKRVANVQKRWYMDQLITGIELPQWVELLKKNEFQVDGTYAHRAAFISALSLPTTALSALEDARFGRQLAAMEIEPTPLFVLGHWRSGTTHLHNLLGRVPQHTYSTVYQVVMPGNFLSTGGSSRSSPAASWTRRAATTTSSTAGTRPPRTRSPWPS